MRSVIALLLISALPLTLTACDRQSTGAEQANVAAANEVTSGEVTADEAATNDSGEAESGFSFKLDTSHRGKAAPDFVFSGPGNADMTLADFAGKPVLVNLWATWCTPCVVEMPMLDNIAGRYAKQGLQVLTISQDSQGAAQVDPFFAKQKFTNLKSYLDPENQFGFHYATGLLPTTVLYDAQGKEVSRVIGAMDWEGERAAEIIAEAL